MSNLRVWVSLSVCWVVSPATMPCWAVEAHPNVVLIFCDDMGYGDLGCYGSQTQRTPNIDRLATEGRRFTDFYVAANVCTPSRAALLTGCYAKRVGLQHRVLSPYSQTGLHPDEITLAELLQSQGYATACFGKWHLGHLPEFLPTQQGFDEYWGIPYSNDMGNHFYPTTSRGETIGFLSPPLPVLEQTTLVEEDPDQRYLTARTFEKCISFIEKHREQPFFCYLPLNMPHTPIAASPRFRGKSSGGLYGDVIEEIDWAVGQLTASLVRLGLSENTIVMFTSDNGGVLASVDDGYGRGSCGPLRGSKGTTWEGGHRVPFIVRWPAQVPAGSECTKMTLSMDILPTVARLAGTSEPQDRIIDGRDAYALWTGDADVQSPHSAYFYYSNEELQAVRSGDWKLHVIRADWQAQGFEKSDYYLFNLREDISESTNLAAKHPEIVEQLKRLIDDARVDLGDSAVPAAVGQGIRMAGLSELPPSPFVPESLERLAPDSELRETILESLHAATPLAYKMRGWEWGQPEGHSLKLDAWWPLGSGPWPIVIWIHGEHDGQGFKEMLEHPARRVAAEGFACVCIDYRPSTDDLLSADLQDCLSAINWVQREAARIHGDPTRIAIVGESSGGKLALLAAYGTAAEQPAHAGFSADSPAPWVQAVIAIDSFGDANTLDAAQLDAHDPPTLLISGGQRELASQTREIQHLLTSHAIPHEVLRLNDASPGFMVRDWNSESSRRAVDEVVRFLKQAFP